MARKAICALCQLERASLRLVSRRSYATEPETPKPNRFDSQEALKHLRQQTSKLTERSQALRKSLEQRLVDLSANFSRFTGYEHIEELKQQVESCEIALLEARAGSREAKVAFEAALEAHRLSQRESNELLQRKSTWSEADVSRFTELVRRDHITENESKEARKALAECEEAVEKGFSALMSAILARYHEEQVWSDKIRSVSTYGSLAITTANVVVFLLAILLVEPWRRNRLIEGVESRLHDRETERTLRSEEGLSVVVDRLDQAETKLDAALARLAPAQASPPNLGAVLQDLMAADEVDELVVEHEDKRWREIAFAGLGGLCVGALGVAVALWR